VNSRSKYIALAAALVMPLVFTGCSGVNASGSVSPASFFLPGLMQVDPQPETVDPLAADPADVKLVAQAR